jgi:hypothetical protein
MLESVDDGDCCIAFDTRCYSMRVVKVTVEKWIGTPMS